MRLPVVAGQFYPARKEELIETIRECFLHKLGKGKLPALPADNQEIRQEAKLKGIISPHAGFVFSGPCASHVFYEVAVNPTPDTYIVLGLSHHGFETSLSDEDFKTPLGILKNNRALTNQIARSCNIGININSHKHEHSLEVLLPFLQFVKSEKSDNIQIVPIIIDQSSLDEIERIGKSLSECLKEYDKEIIFLVSSDFTHFGPNYGYMPGMSVKELDMKAIELITSGKTKELYEFYMKTGATICGIFPILVLLETLKSAGHFKKAELLSYYKSTEMLDYDKSNSVSYAGIKFDVF